MRRFALILAAFVLIAAPARAADGRWRLLFHGSTTPTYTSLSANYCAGSRTLQVAGATWGIQDSEAPYALEQGSDGRLRFEVHTGDVWLGCTGTGGDYGRIPAKNRSEVTSSNSFNSISGTIYWIAESIRVNDTGTPTQNSNILMQLHDSADVGDTTSGPIWDFRFNSRRVFQFDKSWCLVDPCTGFSNTTVWNAPIPANLQQWYDVVVQWMVNRTDPTHGLLNVWINGEQVVSLPDTPLGYINVAGDYPKTGIYMTQQSIEFMTEVANVQGPTTSSLASRITNPPAMPAPVPMVFTQ